MSPRMLTAWSAPSSLAPQLSSASGPRASLSPCLCELRAVIPASGEGREELRKVKGQEVLNMCWPSVCSLLLTDGFF